MRDQVVLYALDLLIEATLPLILLDMSDGSKGMKGKAKRLVCGNIINPEPWRHDTQHAAKAC